MRLDILQARGFRISNWVESTRRIMRISEERSVNQLDISLTALILFRYSAHINENYPKLAARCDLFICQG